VRQKDAVEAVVRLGYPAYFVAILGFWKVLGGIALLVPRFPRLKEWAYAGAFFDLTGAAASKCGVRQRELARGRDSCLSSAHGDFVGAADTKPHAGNSLSPRAFSS
jgi:hypothetical protein